MRTANNSTAGTIVITVSRFGHNPVSVSVPVDSTVQQALASAGVSVQSHEQLFVSGVQATAGDILDAGDILSVVTPKQAGSN